jgi:GxxExxY protein
MTQFENEKYPYKKETYKIIGLGMEIHRIIGKGCAEIVYKDAFMYEFKQNDIPYEREKEYAVKYKDTILPHKFYADFVVYDQIILEIKSKKNILEEHYAQVMNYLSISGLEIGLLINFHEKSLEYKRIVMGH